MSSKSGSSCSARVHVFGRYSNYQQFLLNGDVSELASSYCINSTERLDFKILSQDKNQYFFIGLESLSSTTLDYTVIRNVLEYNVSNSTRPPTTCAFSTSCSISLDNYPGAGVFWHLYRSQISLFSSITQEHAYCSFNILQFYFICSFAHVFFTCIFSFVMYIDILVKNPSIVHHRTDFV